MTALLLALAVLLGGDGAQAKIAPGPAVSGGVIVTDADAPLDAGAITIDTGALTVVWPPRCPPTIFDFSGYGPCADGRGADAFSLRFEDGELRFVVVSGGRTYEYALVPVRIDGGIYIHPTTGIDHKAPGPLPRKK